MIGVNKDEKFLFKIKIFVLIIEAIVVGLIAFIFFGVSKVNAATTTNYTASDNYYMGSGGNGTLANDTWKTFTGYNTWTATNTNWYTAMNGMATAYLRINYKDMTINNANTIGQIIGIRVYLNNTYVSGTVSSYTCVKESSTTGYCDFAVQFAVNGENVIIVQTYRKNEGSLTNPTFKWNAHIELDTSSVVTPNTIQNQTQQIINNQNANYEAYKQWLQDTNTTRWTEEDEIQEEQTGLLQSILSSIGNLFSSSVDDPSNSLSGLSNNMSENNAVSSLLLLPVTIFQKVINSINGTCQSFTLGELLGHNLVMPCIHIDTILGSALYGVIDVILSGFLIYHIRNKLVKIWENLTSLKTGGNELE